MVSGQLVLKGGQNIFERNFFIKNLSPDFQTR